MDKLFKNVTAVFFSATGTNRRSVEAIASGFAEKYDELDLTKKMEKTVEAAFGPDDLVVIGAPVYGGRIYKGAMERFSGLKGDHTSCIVTATYGNRHYDDALLELADAMKTQGFEVIAAAALVGQHTFGEIQVGRPDADDLLMDKEFAKKVLEKCENYSKVEWPLVEIPGNRPYKEGGNGGKFRPSTTASCNNCGTCIKVCPENTIASDMKTIASDQCISCFACIRNCPQHAKVMSAVDYIKWAADFTKRLENRRENEYFV